MSPPSVLGPRKHCSCSRRIDAHGGRPTWRPIFGSFLTKIHTFLHSFYQNIYPSVENVLLHKRSVVDQSSIKSDQKDRR